MAVGPPVDGHGGSGEGCGHVAEERVDGLLLALDVAEGLFDAAEAGLELVERVVEGLDLAGELVGSCCSGVLLALSCCCRPSTVTDILLTESAVCWTRSLRTPMRSSLDCWRRATASCSCWTWVWSWTMSLLTAKAGEAREEKSSEGGGG